MSNIINLKAEREAISWALNGYANEVVARLKPNDISDSICQPILRAMLDCLAANIDVSPVSVSSALKRRGEFETIGGITRLEQFAESKRYNLDVAIEAVLDASRKRRMRESAENIVTLIDAGNTPSDTLSGLMFDTAMDISGDDIDESVSMSKCGDSWWEEVQAVQRGVPRGYACGIPTIDEAVGGIRPGELIGITGAPGRGKSLWALKIAIENAMRAENPVPIVLYSLEMSRVQVYNRAAVMVSDSLNLRQLRGGPGIPRLSSTQLREAKKIKGLFDKIPLYIGDRFDTDSRLFADARIRVRRDGVKIVIIDYAQLLLQGTGMNEASELANISRKSKRFAQNEDVAVILLLKMKQSASTDALKGNAPTGDMVYGSGAFYYDSNVLLWIHVDDPQYICNCESQTLIDKNTKQLKSRHVKEEEGLPCIECGAEVTKAEFRLGRINALKVRDGEAGAEAQITMRGARMRLEETGRATPEITEIKKGTSRLFREELMDDAEPNDDEEAA